MRQDEDTDNEPANTDGEDFVEGQRPTEEDFDMNEDGEKKKNVPQMHPKLGD